MAVGESPGALAGLRVLDVSNFMAGPTAAMYLGDFGAEVIKIEHPRGDGFRHWGRTREGDPLFWKILSRNKRCVTLNMGKPEGQAILKDLVRISDIVVENFTPGVMAKWHLAYEDLAKVNPRLVMLSISAFGQDGPYALRPGFGRAGGVAREAMRMSLGSRSFTCVSSRWRLRSSS
jgi:formyl-CoA transferase